MKKKKKMSLRCPCCQRSVDHVKLELVGSLLPHEGFISVVGKRHLKSFMMVLSKYPSLYQWACDDCINNKRAILAIPKKQFYTFTHPWDSAFPFLAYFDKSFTCKTCEAKTIFSKEEQQHWYEKLSFIVHSKPKNCKNCRKELRKQNTLNTALSELLKDGTPKEKDKLLRIAEIYKEMGKVERMKEYLKAANRQ